MVPPDIVCASKLAAMPKVIVVASKAISQLGKDRRTNTMSGAASSGTTTNKAGKCCVSTGQPSLASGSGEVSSRASIKRISSSSIVP